MPNIIAIAGTAVMSLAVILLIVGAGHPGQAKVKATGFNTANYGVFRFCTDGTSQCSTYDNDDYKGFNAAVDDFEDKQKASAAFMVFSIFAAIGAIVGFALAMMEKSFGGIVALISSGVATFTSLIVWAVWAGLISDIDDIAGRDAEGGAAFGATVTAWLLCIAGTVLGFLAFRKTGSA